MNLYLARHGEAASSSPGSSATLTSQGKQDLTRMGLELNRKKIHVQQIWYSPKTRTRETAAIYASSLGLSNSMLIENENLSMERDVDLIYQEILESSVKDLMIVSHQPLLEELSSYLISGSNPLPHLAFPTSSIAAFGKGTLWEWRWLWYPEIFCFPR